MGMAVVKVLVMALLAMTKFTVNGYKGNYEGQNHLI